MNDATLRVGIIGTGWIAEKAAITLNGLSDCQAYAVGSRRQETADAFAKRWDIAKAYGSYGELIADPDVDLVYVGTPHSHHYDVTRQALLDGRLEPLEMPLDETLFVMQLMDRLRQQWGVHYPMDDKHYE